MWSRHWQCTLCDKKLSFLQNFWWRKFLKVNISNVFLRSATIEQIWYENNGSATILKLSVTTSRFQTQRFIRPLLETGDKVDNAIGYFLTWWRVGILRFATFFLWCRWLGTFFDTFDDGEQIQSLRKQAKIFKMRHWNNTLLMCTIHLQTSYSQTRL